MAHIVMSNYYITLFLVFVSSQLFSLSIYNLIQDHLPTETFLLKQFLKLFWK